MTVIRPEAPVEIHRAGYLMIRPEAILENGYAVTANGVVRETGCGKPPADASAIARIIDHGPGVLMPALVNAHTHLELCALHDLNAHREGFRSWVARLVEQRARTSETTLVGAARSGIDALTESGCAVVGEVATLGLTRELMAAAGMGGVWFREYLGDMPADPPPIPGDAPTVVSSLAGHAPHTTAPEFLSALKTAARRSGRMFSIHLAESGDEQEFITTGKGAWADFLKDRGIAVSGWPVEAGGPVAYAERFGLLDRGTLAVHLLHASPADFECLKQRRANVCVCPRSNAALHGRMADLEGMLAAGLTPCLGTDSLASAPSLNLFDEMAFAAENYPGVSPARLLAMVTVNGAAALGLADRFGAIEPGKAALFHYRTLSGLRRETLLEGLVHGSH